MATKRAPATPAKKAGSVKKPQSTSTNKASPAKAAAKKSPAKATAPKAAPAKKAAPAAKKAPATNAAPAKKAPAPAAAPATERRTGPTNGTHRPGSVKSPYDKKFLEAQRELLLEERATLAAQAEALKAEADALARDREPGDVQFDDESGEGDTLAVERDFDLARAAAALQTIEEIDAALERIDKGVYGVCEYSGEPIPKERLEAIPYARERVEYKTRSFR